MRSIRASFSVVCKLDPTPFSMSTISLISFFASGMEAQGQTWEDVVATSENFPVEGYLKCDEHGEVSSPFIIKQDTLFSATEFLGLLEVFVFTSEFVYFTRTYSGFGEVWYEVDRLPRNP